MVYRKAFKNAVVTLLILLTLVACIGKPSVTGKWEQTGTLELGGEELEPGTLWEFLNDGTVIIEQVSGRYSWPDNSHLKIEIGVLGFTFGSTFEYARSGDEIILRDSSTQRVVRLIRYKELPPSPQSLAGIWKNDLSLDESNCFESLVMQWLYCMYGGRQFFSPLLIEFKPDGTFSTGQKEETCMAPFSMVGQFSINGNELHINATGFTTIHIGGGVEFYETAPKSGELTCQIAVSRFRLLFKDAQGRVTIYRRVK
ncbi:MAG: hypothetical protein QXS54_06665 [Candidatus Methanomethylicaceae archaeon]